MSMQIAEIPQNRDDEKGIVLSVTQHFGGDENGVMLQITQGIGSQHDPGFINLTFQEATYLKEILDRWIKHRIDRSVMMSGGI